jgi:hypothetical protein
MVWLLAVFCADWIRQGVVRVCRQCILQSLIVVNTLQTPLASHTAKPSDKAVSYKGRHTAMQRGGMASW